MYVVQVTSFEHSYELEKKGGRKRGERGGEGGGRGEREREREREREKPSQLCPVTNLSLLLMLPQTPCPIIATYTYGRRGNPHLALYVVANKH